jgi:hypothetical protein
MRPRAARASIPARDGSGRVARDNDVTAAASRRRRQANTEGEGAAHCTSAPRQSHWTANDSDLLPNEGMS